jgi:oxygen-independent coproporphyrinogen-3 oxidase
MPQSAYLHIPFCRRRCYYCDFPISVVGDRSLLVPGEPLQGSNSGTIAQYVEVLCQEIQLAPVPAQPLETVFLGGGTPSLLSVSQLNQILEVLHQRLGIAATAEISMEMDPGTFDLAQLQGYRAAGITRVSLGVQAFQAELLAVCGRSHTIHDIGVAVDLIHRVAIPSFSLDLISGLPHQTLSQWHDSLKQAIALQPNHVSCYDLTIESMTPFGRQYKPGQSPLPSDETTAQMYRLAQQILTTAGYDHYEISNYAQPGYQCRHNRVYWENRPFYGFGMGATSYLQRERFARPRKTREYAAWVEKMHQQSRGSAQEALPLDALTTSSLLPGSSSDTLLDTLMLGLRLAEGLSRQNLEEKFGQAIVEKICQCLSRYEAEGWVQISRDRLCLNDPEGFLFSNVMLTDLFEVLD